MCQALTHCGLFFGGGSRRMETGPTSIEVLLRPTLGQSEEPSDLRGSLSPTTRHCCTQCPSVYSTWRNQAVTHILTAYYIKLFIANCYDFLNHISQFEDERVIWNEFKMTTTDCLHNFLLHNKSNLWWESYRPSGLLFIYYLHLNVW